MKRSFHDQKLSEKIVLTYGEKLSRAIANGAFKFNPWGNVFPTMHE
jgi:hypothetical protein